ncbi:MAG: hypothetical protein ACQEQM_05345, partial [Thermoplasmatota archaeon]
KGLTNGKTNGKVNGRTNGLTNGKTNGKVNGRTNGLTNGKTNGKVNGRTNGLTNGKTNGKVNGRTNGLTNGKTNGKVNGKINGLVNGQEKGIINGLNGFINGDSSDESIDTIIGGTSLSGEDGLVDGIVGMGGEEELYSDYFKEKGEKSLPAEDGLINGLIGDEVSRDDGFLRDTLESENFVDRVRMPYRGMPPNWFKKGLGTVVIMIFLLTIPIMLNLLYIPVEVDVEIDGNFDDWDAVSAYYDPENIEVEDTSLDIREYRLKESEGYLYIYMRTNGTLFETDEGAHSVRFFIDVEGHGYEIGDIKADYLFEVYGWEENIEGSTLQRFNESRESNDWNGFQNSGGGQAKSEGNELEARFWIGDIAEDKEPSMIIHSKSPRGLDVTSGKVWKGLDSISTSTELFGSKVVRSGELEPLFSFESFSISEDAVMDEVVLEYNDYSSEFVDNIFIYDMKNYTDDEFIGEPIAVYENFENNATIDLNLELTTTPSKFIVAAEIDNEAVSTEPIGLRLVDILCRDGLSTISPPIMENKYIDDIPEKPNVDGAFAFWDEYDSEEDELDDLTPHDAWNPNIDINRHSHHSNERTSFMVGVEGNMMGGADIPYHRSRPPESKDSDGDGIPDIYDPYPDDFTNDGIPDDEMVTEDGYPDIDGNGVADYPYGQDMWLNTTIPEDPQIPEMYWGKDVSRYIGPVELPEVTGEDYLRIFIDSDPDVGYSAPWLDMRADHMINVTGRNMEITSANYVEYDGNGADWDWNVLGEVEAAINRTSLETALNLTDLGIDDYEITYVMTDWENNMDTAVPSPETGYYDNDVMGLTSNNKDLKFYLRENDELLPERGTEQLTMNLRKGDVHSWQSPEFAGDYNITSDITVRLDIDPQSTGSHDPDLSITLYSNGVSIGEYLAEDLTGSGVRTFSIEPETDLIQAGNSLTLETELTTPKNVEVDLFYNSQDGESLVSIPSDGIIDVESLKLFNETGEEDDVFDGGEVVEVRSTVSHKFTAELIEDPTLDVYYPNGTKMISDEPMGLRDEDTSDPSYWTEYNYSFILDEMAVGGRYDVVVSSSDIQGNEDIRTTSFIVPDTPGISVYPDNLETTDPGTDISHEVFVENIGNLDDIYRLSVSPSNRDWYTELVCDGESVAVDEDGDGTWELVDENWDSTGDGYPDVSLGSLEEKRFELIKSVPEGAEGELDYTSLYAESYEYDISDFAEMTTQTPVPEEGKTLYLKDNFDMDTFMGENLDVVTIDTSDEYTWSQNPEMADTFELLDYSNVFLYIDPDVHGHQVPDVTVALREDGETISTDTIKDISETGLYQFAIKSDHTIDAGNSLDLRITTGDSSVDVYYGSETYDSRVEMHTNTYVNVDEISTYNESSETDEFNAGETIEVRSIVSDPLGSYDIDGATINVTDPEGETIISEESMNLIETDPEDPSLWNEYTYSFELLEDALVGEYRIDVTGIESNGVTSSSDGVFQVLGNVTVDPDQNDTAEAGTNITYDFTIKNDGSGVDIYSLNLGSNNGWNISLYDSDGTWIGTDIGGNGNWDEINNDYDTTGDGVPDTGYMTPLQEMDMTMEIEIPNGTEDETIEATTLTAISNYDSSTKDSAQAVTTISEFSDIFLPVLSTIGLFVGMFIYRRKREKDNHLGDNGTDSNNVYHNEDSPTDEYRIDSVDNVLSIPSSKKSIYTSNKNIEEVP